jgi:hypothetical protein
MKNILNPRCVVSGGGVPHGKFVCYPKAVIVALNNQKVFLPIIFCQSLIRKKVLKTGTLTLADSLTGDYSLYVKHATTLKPKRRINRDEKLKKWKWPYLRVSFAGNKEYCCPHGVGHGEGIHGCDGCCKGIDFSKKGK